MTAKRIYFFSGTQYSRFDDSRSGVNTSYYPQDIATRWPSLPGGPIDGALNWGANRVFFFVGNQYYSWDIRRSQLRTGYPKPIAGNWPGFVGTGFENGIDDAVNWGNGKMYFFKGDQYLRYDRSGDAVDPFYPRSIATWWPALAAAGWTRDFDAVVNRGNGFAYFFKGTDYLKYEIATDKVVAGYPKPIAGNWGGVFAGGVTCGVEWPYARVDAAGFRVPVRMGAWTQTAVPGGSQAQITFDMEVDFINSTYPESCPVGEYRQDVRGQFTRGGLRVNHPLANANGGPAVAMQVRPAAGAPTDNFLEDGLAVVPAGMNRWYGHRDDLISDNSDTTTTYLPDPDTGCQYRGNDAPGLPGPTGVAFTVDLDFRARAIDRATSDLVLQETRWNVNTAGTF